MKKIFAMLLALMLSLSAAAALAEAYTVTDVFGREVEIPSEINDVAALGSAARLMCYAGATEKLMGVTETDLNANPGRPYSYLCHEALGKCVALSDGGSYESSYTEEIVDRYPDVIFYFDSDTAAMDEIAAKTGLPVVGVYAETCFSDTFYDSLNLIGRIMGTTEQTDKVVAALKGWAEDLDNRTKDIPEDQKPTVYAGAVNWSGTHGIEGTYGQYAPFVAVHAKNVVDETGATAFVEIDPEQILEWDPDYLFLTITNMDIINEDYAGNPDFYEALSAVENGKVYSQVNFNSYWCNLELAVVDAYYVGKVIYPDAFADVDIDAKVDEVFTVMLGAPYAEVLAENGMNFCPITIGE